jgi:polysaccharide biosynthesis protein PslG
MRRIILPYLSIVSSFCSAIVFSLALPCLAKDSATALVIPDCFGVNIHSERPTWWDSQLDSISLLGVKLIRMDLIWSTVEKQMGVYDFAGSGSDALVEGCARRGIRLLYILGYTNSLYGGGDTWASQTARDGYAAFCKAAAAHYKSKHIIYEIFNEPNGSWFWSNPDADSYTAMALEAAAAIREVDSESLIIAPAVCCFFYDMPYLETCFRDGLLNVTDLVSVHPYGAPNPEAVTGYFDSLHQMIARYAPGGKSINICSGEWGYPKVGSDIQSALTDSTQAAYVVREFLTLLWQGSPINIWYVWLNTTDEWVYSLMNLFDNNLVRTLAFNACHTMITVLSGCQIDNRIDLGDANDYAFVLSSGVKHAVACWTTSDSHAATIPFDQGSGTLVGMLGDSTQISWDTTGVAVTLSQSPQYLLVSNASSIRPQSDKRATASSGSFLSRMFNLDEKVAAKSLAVYDLSGRCLMQLDKDINDEVLARIDHLGQGVHVVRIVDSQSKVHSCKLVGHRIN